MRTLRRVTDWPTFWAGVAALMATVCWLPAQAAEQATQACAGYRSPGTNIVDAAFSYSTNRVLASLMWQPTLPVGWTLGTAWGDGSPEVNGTNILFVGNLSTNPVQFHYQAIAPAGETGSRQIAGFAEYLLDAMINPVRTSAAPDPLMILDGHPPVVSNVRFLQRPGAKLLDIKYDVFDAAGDALAISVAVSTNRGVTYDVPAASFSGAGWGMGVLSGANLPVVWNAGADWNGQVTTNLRVKVTADDAPTPAGMSLIPAGTFSMGDSLDGNSNALPVHAVYVSAFYMDQYDVTKAKWDEVYTWAITNGYAFDNAGSGKAADHPVQKVNWYDCVKWCNARSEKEGRTPAYYTNATQSIVYRAGRAVVASDWVKWTAGGYRLPTEAEWEKAARGGAIGRRFPWGDTIDHSWANYNGGPGFSYDTGYAGADTRYATGGFPYTSPAGSLPANGFGLCDMAGNVWQWSWDFYQSGWYGNAGATLSDPHGPTSGENGYRVLRGGAWSGNANYACCASRYSGDARAPANYVGFRCVR